MNESNLQRIDEFLGKFEMALGRSSRQSKEILAEVCADLHAHVKRHRADGCTEDEAVGRALDQLGNPYELAHHVRWEVPPFVGDLLTTVRYIAACSLALWLVMLLWFFRAGSYGGFGSLVVVGTLLLHLPVILLLWPQVVWRINLLFGLVPAGLAFVMGIWLAVGGVQSNQTLETLHASQNIDALQNEEGELSPQQLIEALEAPLADAGLTSVSTVLIFSAAAFATVVLLIAMLLFAVVEVPFQVEEAFFRRDRELARAHMDTRQETKPTTEDVTAIRQKLINSSARFQHSGEHFSLFWNRPLCSGFSIQFSSQDGRVSVQD
jgi:hypothetical protein